MNNVNYKNLMDDEKIIYFLGLAEKIVTVFSQEEDKLIAQDILDSCWKWVQDKQASGEYFYNLLDDEDKGITIIQEMSEVEKDRVAWNCVIDALAYTSRKVFEKEGAKYFPEPIALVDDELIDHFIECFNNCITNSEEYIKKIDAFLNEYKFDSKSDFKGEVLKRIQ